MVSRAKNLSVPCSVKQVRVVKECLRELLEGQNVDEEELFNLQLVIDEAVINAIDHGSANNMQMNVDINFVLEDAYLTITVKDFGGKAFNPEFFERIAAKKNWGKGGRGIFLIKQFMDEVRYIFSPGVSTLLSMSKKLTINNENSADMINN
ncbi:MAG: hypothetical protein A2X42_02925 [Candidatus Margulisbacteria bacterium GWF2_38_17]|nr:MAG: hypothetical protein A2X43_06285 [Candidatus Margulisbacteria bacterium GWD2_39_127]OGI05242.1 MAG: hypothetical protein A2X42_02925 [Candidatus Margulisbacteria bacterium GWF2_38_17]OGI06291.1 MAG: hypothetical protein A2X41_08505 [Candidatus Margulisbacteria bacterium GWE2_39_32]